MSFKALKAFRRIGYVLISLICVLFFAACEMYDLPVREYFEFYTDSVAVAGQEDFGPYPVSESGIVCIPSSDDYSLSFWLRNPQNYSLVPKYTFDKISGYSSNDVIFTQSDSDRSIITLTFRKEFLRSREEMRSLNAKDLSGAVSLYEPLSGRSFDNFHVSLHANTPPPAVVAPCFQLSSSGNDATYIVCFYLPKVRSFGNRQNAANPIHSDTHDFYVNGEHLYINDNDDNDNKIYTTRTDDGTQVTYSDEDSRFVYSAPSGMTSLEANGFEFDTNDCPDPNVYVPVYFLTGVTPTTDIRTYTFTLRDDDGLENSISISNVAKQLNSPVYDVEASHDYIADEENGLYAVRIYHDGFCTDGTSCGGVTINYRVEETNGINVFDDGTSAVMSGVASGSITLRLPRGKYEISATASKSYYLMSEKSSVDDVSIKQAAIFYVRNNGEDSDNGSRATPFRTVQAAIESFKNGIQYNEFEIDSPCEIRLLSDITAPADFDFANNDNSFVNISGAGFTNSILIKGYGGNYAINADRSESATGHVMKIASGCNVTLENLIIKGGYTSSYASSTENEGAGINNNGNLTATDCVIENNTALNTDDGGAGIRNHSSAKLSLTRCTLRNNTSGIPVSNNGNPGCYVGSAIYSDGEANDSCVLNNCTITGNTGGGAINVSRIFMTGGSITNNISTDNTACSGISFSSGTLDSVEISNNDFDESIPVDDRGDSGGGIHACAYGEDGTNSIIKNCTIKNNRASFGAGIFIFEAVSPAEVIIEDCTVTGNKSYTDKIISGAGFVADDDITLKGKNIIYNNYLSDGTTQNNGYFNSTSHPIKIVGNISDSKIGINVPWSSTVTGAPTPGNPAPFTTGYGYGTTNTQKPARIFIAENGYGITYITEGLNAGEAAFGVGGGAFELEDPYDNITIKIDKTVVSKSAASKVFTFSADLIDEYGTKSEIQVGTGTNRIGYAIQLLYHGQTIPSSGGYYSVGTNTITFQNTLAAGDYTINVTARYNDNFYTANFDVKFVEPPELKQMPEYLPSNTDGSAGTNETYIYFGSFPQTVKAEDVTIYEKITKIQGAYTYFLGSDNCWYVRHKENAYTNGYTYSDSTTANVESEDNYRYFKVEPIKWRIVDKNYKESGKWLIICEDLLMGNVAFYDMTSNRNFESTTIYPSVWTYSRIRAYLYGISYYNGADNFDFTGNGGKGFLQTAFGSDEKTRIVETEFSIKVYSPSNSGKNLTSTNKIFLLDPNDLRNVLYHFALQDNAADNARKRRATDFAIANYVELTGSYGAWLTRIPSNSSTVYYVKPDGTIGTDGVVTSTKYGIAPAMCIEPIE